MSEEWTTLTTAQYIDTTPAKQGHIPISNSTTLGKIQFSTFLGPSANADLSDLGTRRNSFFLHSSSSSCYSDIQVCSLDSALFPLVSFFEGIFTKGEVVHEYRFLTKDGAVFWIHDNFLLVNDDQGRPLEVVGAWTEITERKMYEQQLKYFSLHDQLTGLYNRAYLENELARLNNSRDYPIPDHILFKPGPLNDDEWKIMRQHPEKGYRIAQETTDLAGIADLILKHHERWDGKGYPLGLKGHGIPIECRILAALTGVSLM